MWLSISSLVVELTKRSLDLSKLLIFTYCERIVHRSHFELAFTLNPLFETVEKGLECRIESGLDRVLTSLIATVFFGIFRLYRYRGSSALFCHVENLKEISADNAC